jgi:alcohol dehydrogenase class IV
MFGEGAVARAGSFANVLGSRALLVCGNLSGRRNGSVGEAEQSLVEAGMAYEVLEGVPANPAASLVDAGASFARAQHVDVVVAVGGGSVLDAAKAIAIAAVAGRPFREFLSGIRTASVHIDATLPVVAVPTLPGSGSETNGTSVIVDDVSGRKLSAHSELAAPRVALIDPAFAAGAPRELLAPALADALCHAIEAGLSQRASIASDALARTAIAMLKEDAAAAADGDVEAMGRALWSSNLAGQALSLAGSIATHPMAHPLSARCGAHHGAAVAALEPFVIAALAERWGTRAATVAGWMGSAPKSDADAVRLLVRRLAAFNKQLGITTGASDLGLAPELIATFVDDTRMSGSRGLRNTAGEPLTERELLAIYELCLDTHPHVAPKQLGLPTPA